MTRNYSEKSINGILDYVGGGKGGAIEVDILEKFYQATKDALVEAKNEVCIVKFHLINSYLITHGIAVECKDEFEVSQTMARQERVHQTDEGLFTSSESSL